MDTYFLGIDPSATSTGVSLIGSNSHEVLNIKPRTLKGCLRLQYIHQELKGFIDNKLVYMGVIEAPSYGSVHKEFILGEVLGVIKLTLIQNDIFSLAIPPTQIKKFLTGKGHAGKELMIQKAQEYGCPSSQEDICDSWAAALLCKGILLTSPITTRPAFETIKSIKTKYKTDLVKLLNKKT